MFLEIIPYIHTRALRCEHISTLAFIRTCPIEEAYTEFKEKHQSIILAFAKKSTVDATEKFLKDNLVLLDGNSTAFLLMHMLELEMKGV